MKLRSARIAAIAGILIVLGGTYLVVLARKPATTVTLERRARQGSASYADLVELGRRYLGQNRLLDSGEMVFRARKMDPSRWEADALVGELYARAGELQRAEASFRKAVEVAPRLSQPRLSLAQFEITHGMPAAVPADLEPVITHGTRDPHAWLLLGQAQQELGHQFEAANCFREALKLDPKLAEANRGLGVIEMGFDHYGPAVTFLERAYTEGDHSAVNRLAFASALLMRGDAGDSGRAEALLAEGPLPQSPSERFTQGLRLRARGRFADAADMFRAIPATDQTHERATFLLADCLRALGRNREAAAAMETYHRLVQTRQKLGYLTRQAQQAPPTPALLRDLGKTLLESGRPAEAAEQFRAWSRIAPGDPEARRWLSTAEKAQAEKAQAEKAQANDVRGSATRAQ